MKFSIIVPIYNVEKYLRECIESVLNQTYKDFELILVDDGSQDNCPQICDEYKKLDDRVIVIHKKNGGLPSARNAGIRQASGDYFMHLDGDDFFEEKCLEKAFKIIDLEKHDLYLGNSRYDYYGDNSIKVELYDINKIQKKPYNDILKHFFYGKNMMPSAAWHNIYKTKYIKDNNLFFDEELSWSEDADNFFKVLFSTRDIGFFDYTFYYYRKNNQSAMTKNPSLRNILSNIKVSKKWFYNIDNYDISEYTKKIIKTRFANGLMYALKMVASLEGNDFDIAINTIMEDKKMLKQIKGFPCYEIYVLTKILGPKKVSRLLAKIRR